MMAGWQAVKLKMNFSFQMTRYKHTEFNDEDTSSVGSIHLNEATSPAMHIRYHSVRVMSFDEILFQSFQYLTLSGFFPDVFNMDKS